MTTRARQGAVRDKIDAAIQAFEEAAFQCGEWNRDESDEPYHEVLARCDRARERLRRLALKGSPQ